MLKFFTYLMIALVILAVMLRVSLEFEPAQDTAIEQMSRVAMQSTAAGLPDPDSLRAYVCGSASPLGVSDSAQACIAILTPTHFYLVDAGAGSSANIARGRLPVERLQGILLTHFHSDHIAELYEMNLASWVRGRPAPLMVYGPRGVDEIVDGINDTYEKDRQYRIDHHGADLLPPALGKLKDRRLRNGEVIRDGDLTITVYTADRSPIEPAVGYRFDYRGRSIVVSGDSLVTEETRRISDGADLVFHDALSEPLVKTMAESASRAGLDRLSTIMTDVLDYHASTESLVKLATEVDIGMLAYYHLVPTPPNLVMEKAFERGNPGNIVIAKDGDWFELPSDEDTIQLSR